MRSDPLKKGINAAPQRALLKALGLCDAEIERPLIGVVSSQNDIVPGHVFLDKITDAVKQGVALGGGVPIVFPAIAVCDGLAMGHKGMKYSLVSRELIADSVEAMATAHPFDGLVFVAACDKNVPGLLMAAARLNIPSIVISGGAMLAGRACGRKLSYSDISEGVSRFRTGQIDAKTFLELENKSCPTCGSCSGHVHGQFHELPDGSARHGIAGQRHDSRGHVRPLPSCQGGGPGGDGACEKERLPARHHDEGGVRKRAHRRHGARLLDEFHAAPAGHRARVRLRA